VIAVQYRSLQLQFSGGRQVTLIRCAQVVVRLNRSKLEQILELHHFRAIGPRLRPQVERLHPTSDSSVSMAAALSEPGELNPVALHKLLNVSAQSTPWPGKFRGSRRGN